MGQTSERNCWFLWMLQSPMLIALSSRPALLRTPVRKVCFLALAGAALFTLPYLVKVPPVVSLSYEVGFSNRTALVIYVVGVSVSCFVPGAVLIAAGLGALMFFAPQYRPRAST